MWKVDEDVELSGGGQIYDYPINSQGPPRSRNSGHSHSHSHSHGGNGYDNYGSPGPQPGPQQPPRSQPPPQPPQNQQQPPRQTQHQGPHQQRPTLQQKASYNQRNQMYANKHKGNPQLYPQQPHNHIPLQNFHSQPQPDDYNGYNPHISHGQHPNSFDTGGRNIGHHNNPNPEYNHNQRGHPHQHQKVTS